MNGVETATAPDSLLGPGGGTYGPGRDAVRQRILGLFDTALAFRARMSGSEWAEKYGRIPKGTGAESGPVTLYGYQRGLLDAMCDPRIPLVTVLKAARVGYTRCFTLALGYHLDHDPTLCTIAQPTIPDAEEFGGTEIAPMLRETPVLAKQIRPTRKGEKPDKATFYQLANGASARLVGAASDDAFRRYSARFQAADEIDGDGWTPGAKSQGDKLELFWTRGETFYNRKQVRGSTPLLEETSRIWKLWLQSDQRRYFVPCPQCSENAGYLDGWQFLEWGDKGSPFGLKYETDDRGRFLSVWYEGKCGCVIDEGQKAWMDAHGEWRPTAVPEDPGHVGFHLWTGMSLNANASWESLARQWIKAQKDPFTLVQPFVNLRLGRTYRASYGQEVKASKFLERAEDYGAEVPAWARFLSLGGDVQSGADARIEASVYAWGLGLESALVGHFVIRGDPADAKVWAELDALLGRSFRSADGRDMAIQAAAIDSGGHYTAETYAFCNERRTRRVWAIKGKSEVRGHRGKVWPRTPSTKLGSSWYMVGGNAARDWAYGSLAADKPGPRFVHFPRDGAAGSRAVDEEFFEQMTREKLVARRQGYTEWDKSGRREVGVCWVYSYVAVCGLQSQHALFLEIGRAPPARDENKPEPTPETPDADAPEPEAPALEPASPPVQAEMPAPPPPAPDPPSWMGQCRSAFGGPAPGGWMNRRRE